MQQRVFLAFNSFWPLLRPATSLATLRQRQRPYSSAHLLSSLAKGYFADNLHQQFVQSRVQTSKRSRRDTAASSSSAHHHNNSLHCSDSFVCLCPRRSGIVFDCAASFATARLTGDSSRASSAFIQLLHQQVIVGNPDPTSLALP
ncbi:hypothetical protein KCV07_g10089, partial [Aureobasidium melanogenum]